MLKISITAGLCLALAGCGEMHRRNELFSSSVVQPTTQPTTTAASLPQTQVVATRQTASAVPRQPDAGAATATVRTEPPVPAVAARAPDTNVQVASIDVSEERDRARPAARTAGSPEPTAAAVQETVPSRPVPPVVSGADARREGGAQTALIAPSEGENPPRPAARSREPSSSGEMATDGPQPATSGQIMGGILRTWNRLAAAELSSKVLFGVWPEQLDGVPPDLVELQKRSELAARR